MISLVLPCYNEENGLPKTVGRIPKIIDEVVVSIDKKTSDNTFRVAKKLGLKVVQENTDGYGATLLMGINSAFGEIIATADGDATYPIEEIPKIVEFLKKNKLDFVSCSRFPLKNKNSMKKINYLGNIIITFLLNLLWKQKIKDGLSGMWVFKKSAFKKMRLVSNGWNLSEEIKIEAVSNPEIKFNEFHINYHQREGFSKLPKIKTGIDNILFLFRKKYRQTFID